MRKDAEYTGLTPAAQDLAQLNERPSCRMVPDMDIPKRQPTWRFLAAAAIVFVIWYFFLQPRAQTLDASEQVELLRLARAQLVAAVSGSGTVEVDESVLSPRLLEPRSAFVTLSLDGALRGCMIDTFEPHEPLYQNVLHNTALAATGDERFPAVTEGEIDAIGIAISVLTVPRAVAFSGPEVLIETLEPNLDGVILTIEDTTASYLPEIWETFPDPEEFLSQLCAKAGWSADRWRREPYPEVLTYRTFRFEEGG